MELVAIALACMAGLSDLLSGMLPLYVKLREWSERYVIAFAAGSLLGVFFFEMLPEIDVAKNFMVVALGFFSFYLLENLVMLHSCREGVCDRHSKAGWPSVLGMASDNVIDGVGIAVGYALNPLTGLLMAFAVVMHEIPQGISSSLILKRSGFSRGATIGALALQGLLYPVGAALSYFIPSILHPAVLAFVAGDFLYIAASDMLPDAHKRFNWKVVAFVILGAAASLALETVFKVG